MRVAIVCDWLTGIGGAERVIHELHRIYPNAPIYTSQYDPEAINWFDKADVRTGWLQKLPVSLKKFLPLLRAWTFSRLDLSSYDLVISSSGAEAKFIKVKPGAVHISYCHAPTHYYWSRYEQYLNHPGFGWLDPIGRLGLKLLVGPMRRWDYKAAQGPSYLIANSTYTAAQIKKYYRRESIVIHPPVDISRFKSTQKHDRQGLLIAGRQTPYKRFDLAVAAATELDKPLTVVGDGPEHSRLVSMAGPSITFLQHVYDEQMTHAFWHAEGFVFPGLDDFGVVAVEAMAAGTPVIAYRDGGALDYIIPGETGVFFDHPNAESLAVAIKKFDPKKFDEKTIKKAAARFSAESFQRQFKDFIAQKI